MIDVARIAFAQREYRTTPAIEDTAIKTRHPLAVEMEYNTLLQNFTDASAFGATILALRRLDRWTWACFVAKANYPPFEVGKTITIKYPRYGFTNGKNFIVKKVRTDSNAMFDELVLFGPQEVLGSDTAITSYVAIGDSQTANGGSYADGIITDFGTIGITGNKVAQGSRVLGVPADRGNLAINSEWAHIDEVVGYHPQLVSFWDGHNSLPTYAGATNAIKAQNFYNDCLAYFDYLKANLPGVKIIWIIPTNAGVAYSGYALTNSILASLRPLVRAGADGIHYDAFADFGAHPQMVDSLDSNLSDGLHVTGAAANSYLKPVLRAVANSFILNQVGSTPNAFDLGADVTEAATSSDAIMDVIVAGLGPRTSLTGASATNAQIKQGFGSYGSSIATGQLFNGDVVRLKHTTSASPAALTTPSLTLQPGSVTDSRNFTTTALSLRTPATQLDSTSQQFNWIGVSNFGKTGTGIGGDVGGTEYIASQQPIIAGRNTYMEGTLDFLSTGGAPSISLIAPSMMKPATSGMFVNTPGNGVYVGFTYRNAGTIYANGAVQLMTAGGASYPGYSTGQPVGFCMRDNLDGTITIWVIGTSGTVLQPSPTPTPAWVPWVTGGWTITAPALYPGLGIKNADIVTLNFAGPFALMSSAALAAANAHAVDEAPSGKLVRSTSYTYINNANSATIAIPAGSVAGDDIIIFASHAWAVNALSGFTDLNNRTGSGTNGRTFKKTLTSGDITAGSFSLTFTGTYYGHIAAVTIQGTASVRDETSYQNAPGATSRALVSDATPQVGDLILTYAAGRFNGTVVSSLGAVARSNSANESSMDLRAGMVGTAGVQTSNIAYGSAPNSDYGSMVILY